MFDDASNIRKTKLKFTNFITIRVQINLSY